MSDIQWSDGAPIYRQLKERVIAMMLDGILKPGDALPSVRQVAADYQLNPITVAVEAFHFAFWLPTTERAEAIPPNLFSLWIPIALVTSGLMLVIGQLVFRRLEGRFAQEL